MPLGILEPKGVEHVPGTPRDPHAALTIHLTCHVLGTVNVFEENQAREHVQPNTGLKYDTSGPKPIILVPQPSDDPNDPLVRAPNCLACRIPNNPISRTGQSGVATLYFLSFRSSP